MNILKLNFNKSIKSKIIIKPRKSREKSAIRASIYKDEN